MKAGTWVHSYMPSPWYICFLNDLINIIHIDGETGLMRLKVRQICLARYWQNRESGLLLCEGFMLCGGVMWLRIPFPMWFQAGIGTRENCRRLGRWKGGGCHSDEGVRVPGTSAAHLCHPGSAVSPCGCGAASGSRASPGPSRGPLVGSWTPGPGALCSVVAKSPSFFHRLSTGLRLEVMGARRGFEVVLRLPASHSAHLPIAGSAGPQ